MWPGKASVKRCQLGKDPKEARALAGGRVPGGGNRVCKETGMGACGMQLEQRMQGRGQWELDSSRKGGKGWGRSK